MWIELWETFEAVARSTEGPCARGHRRRRAFSSGQDPERVSEAGDHGLVRMRRVGDVALAFASRAEADDRQGRGDRGRSRFANSPWAATSSWPPRTPASRRSSRAGVSRVDFGGSWVLPRVDRTAPGQVSWAFFAEIVSAKEAADIGLVNRVVPATELDAFVEGWARTLAAGPPLALSMTKTMLNNGLATSMEHAVGGRGPLPGHELLHRRHRRGRAGL